MGTPHRGGGFGSLGKNAERVVRYLGFDTNDSILKDLRGSSTSFKLVHEEFMRVLEKKAPLLSIYSFQEEDGLVGVQGLNGKVVEDDSSKLGYRYETVASLPGDHREMCQLEDFYGRRRLLDAVSTLLDNIKGSSAVFSDSNLRTQIHSTMNLPFERDTYFVGRKDELLKLEASLASDKFSECAIVGLGGVG